MPKEETSWSSTFGSSSPASVRDLAEKPVEKFSAMLYEKTEVHKDELIRLESRPRAWRCGQARVAGIVNSQIFDTLLGVIIFMQLAIAVAETDILVDRNAPPVWIQFVNWSRLFMYCVELSMRIYVYECEFFESYTNMYELSVVLVDLGCELLRRIIGHLPSVSILRILRLSRVLRVGRMITKFDELYTILHSLVGAVKAIFWTTIVLAVTLTLFSMLAVEFIHPLNVEVLDSGAYDGCDRCGRAFASVMQSNLTFFQAIVAGGSWGLVIIPFIERFPSTAPYFLFVTLVLLWGLMNLVLSVIVEQANEAKVVRSMKAKIRAKRKLLKTCQDMDRDGSGTLSLAELEEGAEKFENFKDALKVLGVKLEELHMVFNVMDSDKSGSVTYAEFVESLHKMKTQDDHTLLVLIKHYTTECREKIIQQLALLKDSWQIEKVLHKLASHHESSATNRSRDERELHEEGMGMMTNAKTTNLTKNQPAVLLSEPPAQESACGEGYQSTSMRIKCGSRAFETGVSRMSKDDSASLADVNEFVDLLRGMAAKVDDLSVAQLGINETLCSIAVSLGTSTKRTESRHCNDCGGALASASSSRNASGKALRTLLPKQTPRPMLELLSRPPQESSSCAAIHRPLQPRTPTAPAQPK